MNEQVLWYVSRGTGLVCLVLLSGTVVLGALNSGRAVTRRWPRFAVAAVHRNLSLLALAFLAVHVATSIIDTYAGIRWLDAMVPFGSGYRPFWLGLGAVSSDLFIALVVTSLARPRINPKVWRLVHWCAYACWPLAVIHGFGTGTTDNRITWVIWANIACVVACVLAVVWRARTSHADTRVRERGSVWT